MRKHITVAALAALLCHASHANARPFVGRPVRVLSLSFSPSVPSGEVLTKLEGEMAKGVDLVVLPETWRGQNEQSMEPIQGPTVRALSALARRHQAYVVSPLDIFRNGRRSNTAVVIDRSGAVLANYDKLFPYWSEYRHAKPVQPGRDTIVIDTDFGKLGLAICFDVNFPEVWQGLADKGAELVIWPSAYSAGSHLGAYALLHHYYVVTATWAGDSQIYDIDGSRLLDQRGERITVARAILDLDRGIYHKNFNDVAGFVRQHADSVALERSLEREQWNILRATRPGVSVRDLARKFGLTELREYLSASRTAINKMRDTGVVAVRATAPAFRASVLAAPP